MRVQVTLRIGLLAASRIADRAIVQPATGIEDVAVTAVASRSADRAEAAASRWGLDTWYDSYEGLLSSPDIDAVYVGTPNSLHRRWTVASLASGKHVLVEKPLA
ncbi:MAG TPA: Gfo/Idh/MocA family oxidoreductase, partial [Acidimicrobiia bacterium]